MLAISLGLSALILAGSSSLVPEFTAEETMFGMWRDLDLLFTIDQRRFGFCLKLFLDMNVYQ